MLVVLWTGFSSAFEAVFSTLFIPLSLAALGIVLRGSGFAFHHDAQRAGSRLAAEWLFGVSSLLTPFFMGTVVGAIASGRVPVGNAAGDPVTSWLNRLSIVIGALFVATCAYLAAVFLVSDSRRASAPTSSGTSPTGRSWPRSSPARSRPPGCCAARRRPTSSTGLTGEALPLVIVSVVCGSAVLVLLRRGARRGARPLAVGAVTAVIAAWGVAQYPYLLPKSLTIDQAAAPRSVLEGLLIVFVVAVVLVLPGLGLLYSLVQRNLVEETESPASRSSG